ncbi:MAG TPA: branched-chain amino acid ABC transporter permease, partial [Thalassobaculum sp.]
MFLVELFVQGVIQGSVYALIAVGLTLVYGLLRILHVAHAGLFTLGGYAGVLITNATGSAALALLAAALLVGAAGMAIYRFGYEPILRRPPYVALIASIGLYIAMEELFRIVFGPFGLTYDQVPMQGSVVVAGMHLRTAELATVALAAGLIGGLGLLAGRTRLGLA